MIIHSCNDYSNEYSDYSSSCNVSDFSPGSVGIFRLHFHGIQIGGRQTEAEEGAGRLVVQDFYAASMSLNDLGAEMQRFSPIPMER